MFIKNSIFFASFILLSTSALSEISVDKDATKLSLEEQQTLERNSDSYRINVLKNLYVQNSRNGLMSVDKTYLIKEPMSFKEISDFSHPYLNIMVSQLTKKERDDIQESIREENAKQGRYQAIINTAMKFAMDSAFHHETRMYHDSLMGEYYHNLSQVFPFASLMLENGKIKPPLIEEVPYTATIEDKRTIRYIRKRFRIAEQSEVILRPPTFIDEFSNLLTPRPKAPNIYMLPIDDEELKYWQKGVLNGWVQGVKLAHKVIRSNIRMTARRNLGYIRFHIIADRGIVSMPDSNNVAVGTNSRGDVVNIGESVFEIVRLPTLNDSEQDWIAIPQVDDIFNELTDEDVAELTDELLYLDSM